MSEYDISDSEMLSSGTPSYFAAPPSPRRPIPRKTKYVGAAILGILALVGIILLVVFLTRKNNNNTGTGTSTSTSSNTSTGTHTSTNTSTAISTSTNTSTSISTNTSTSVSTSTSTGTCVPGATFNVNILPGAAFLGPNAFSPPNQSICIGQRIQWTNLDSNVHTVSSNNGLFDSGPINPNGTFILTFNASGLYGYHCSIHNSMVGSVTVT